MSADFKSNRAAVETRFQANLTRCLTAIGLKQNEIAVNEITDMGAVDTGRMRASNVFRLGDKEVIVSNTAGYSIFVTLGTRKMAARPFMQNSINNHMGTYRQIVNETMGHGF